MREARAPRKTMVIGTISDYSGKGGEIHRKVARLALEAADRVVFVGPQADHVDRLRRGNVRDRLFAFVTSHQAAVFLAEAPANSSTSRHRSPIILNGSCFRSDGGNGA